MTCPLSPARVLHEIDSRRREALVASNLLLFVPIHQPKTQPCVATREQVSEVSRHAVRGCVAGLRHERSDK